MLKFYSPVKLVLIFFLFACVISVNAQESVSPVFISVQKSDQNQKPVFQSFQTWDSTSFNPAENVYWVRYVIDNKSDNETLVLEFPGWTDVQVFSNNTCIGQTGHQRPHLERSLPLGNRNFIEIEVRPYEKMAFKARLAWSPSYTVAPTTIHPKLFEKQEVIQADQNERKYVYFFIGLYVFIILFNMFLTYTLKSKAYRLYVVFVFFNLVALLHNVGYTHEIFDFVTWYPNIFGFSDAILSSAFGLVILEFSASFLSLKENLPKLWRPYRFFQLAMLLVCIPAFFGQVAMAFELSSLLGLLTSLFVFIMALSSVQKKVPGAKTFLLAVSFFIVGLFIFLLKEIGVLESNNFTNFSFYIGSSLEALLFSIALGGKIKSLENENRLQQEELIQQLKTNEALQTKVNKELEEKVRARTGQLEEQSRLLTERNRVMEDNLLYAKNIQSAIFQSQMDLEEFPVRHFVLQEAENLVGGNFCWSYKVNDDALIWATVESGRSGIPGALMSIVGFVLLNKIVKEKGITKPNLILGELRKGMIDTLSLDKVMFDNKESMKVSVCRLELRSLILKYVGAGNDVLISGENGIHVLETDQQAMNFIEEKFQAFVERETRLQKADIVFALSRNLYSTNSKQSKKKEFLKFLQGASHNDLMVQKNMIKMNWLGKEMTSSGDIIVVGIQSID